MSKPNINLNYKEQGGMLLPDLQISNSSEADRPLGRYGRMALEYLKDNQPERYTILKMDGSLMEVMHRVQDEAMEKIEALTQQMLQQEPMPQTEDTLTSSSDIKQKELLKHEIVEMGGFALSGEVVERQFYIKIWDRTVDGVERDLLQKLKYLSGYFADCGIQTEILEQQDIVRLCNLVNNPAYVHLEDAGFEAAIPILESVGVV